MHTAYWSALTLALVNPMTILPYFAIALTVMLADGFFLRSAAWEVLGAVFAVTLWYAMISGGVLLLPRRLTRALVRRLNLAAGAGLIGFGMVTWLR